MRRSSGFFGTLAVGALAMGVSVYAAPRVETQRSSSDSARKLTSDGANLRSVVDGTVAGGLSFFQLVAIPPQGTQVNGPGVSSAGNTYTLEGGTSERLYFELQLGNWGGTMDVWQATIDWVPSYASGSGADLERVVEACSGNNATGNAECAGLLGTGSSCTGAAPNTCRDGFVDSADPDCVICDIAEVNQAFLTFAAAPIGAGDPDNGQVGYGGVLVVGVPAGAGGTYTIDFSTSGNTFMAVDGSDIVVAELRPGIIDIPVGRCCVLSPQSCQDDVTEGACNDLDGVFIDDGSDCTAACIECVVDGDCNDGDACTTESCGGDNFCDRGLIAGFNPATQCCNGSTGAIVGRDDGDDCTDDSCSGAGGCGGSRNAASCGGDAHTPSAADTACNDDNACTFNDVCDGVSSAADGGCSGTDANSVSCTDSDDCAVATGSSLDCVDGNCFCTLSPALTFDITPGDKADPNCFNDDEKVTATVQVGASLDVITGGEVAIAFTPGCLDLISVNTIAPFNNILFRDDSVPGEIFIAVGIDLGGVGVGGGNFDLVELSFNKTGGCTGCDLCFTDVNPRRTRLTNDVGVAVNVTPECSKEVRGNGTLTLDTPDGGKFNTACDSANRDVNWGAPSASDTCAVDSFTCGGIYRNPFTGEIVDAADIGVSAMGGGNFPIGDATFCCSATNDCGDFQRECWTVTVNDQTSLDVELQLSPSMTSKPGQGLDRCIKFEMFSNCVQAPLVFEETVTFGGLFDLTGKVDSAIKIPSAGQFACITARDPLHTLRSCYTFGDGDCDADGVLHATFKGDPFFGGNWLVGGNLDGYDGALGTPSTNAIDITDFGVFVSQFPSDNGDGNTPCGTAGPDADINGDGLVDLLDFTFVSMNFLEDSKDCCCPDASAGAGAPSGRTSISVREAQRAGDVNIADADLNNDGVVDVTDMGLLLQGVTKEKKSPRGTRGALR